MKATDLDLDLSALPSSPEEAGERFQRWRSVDPYPDIAPALLNAADLFDYIATTGMIHPFRVDPDRVEHWMKPASCGIRLGGRYIYWEYEHLGSERRSELKKFDAIVGRDDGLELPPNSIVYATLEPTIQLPNYIAARFNLSIKYVYRGLLVGTGPLVDPGFQGRLSIPLHNLTAHSCFIPSEDAVLWMEFTKISGIDDWNHGDAEERRGRYVGFPEHKLARKDVGDYVARARHGQSVMSSIPELVEKAAEEARRTRRNATIFQWAAAVALFVLVVAVAAFVVDVRGDIQGDTERAVNAAEQLEDRVQALEAAGPGSPER